MAKIIALIGIDGSGKTTQATLLCNVLRSHGIKARIFYAGNTGIRMGYNYSFYLSLPIDIIRNRLLRTRSNLLPSRYEWLSKLETFLLFLNYLLLILPRMIIYGKIYRVLITDRFVYDYILSTVVQKRYSRTLTKVLLRIVPKPMITILLDVDPLIAYHRKGGEKPMDELCSLRLLYRLFIDSIGGNIIKASGSKMDTFKEILRVVVPCVLKK